MIQRLTFFLGHPTRAMTIMLSALLVSSGIGAAMSRRIASSKHGNIVWWLVPAGAALAAAASHFVLPGCIGFAYGARVALSLVVVVPLGVLMGLPFPLGIERIRGAGESLVPWAFGVNAFFTVLAAALAPLLALETGLSALLAAAVGIYALAAVAWRQRWDRKREAWGPPI